MDGEVRGLYLSLPNSESSDGLEFLLREGSMYKGIHMAKDKHRVKNAVLNPYPIYIYIYIHDTCPCWPLSGSFQDLAEPTERNVCNRQCNRMDNMIEDIVVGMPVDLLAPILCAIICTSLGSGRPPKLVVTFSAPNRLQLQWKRCPCSWPTSPAKLTNIKLSKQTSRRVVETPKI